MSAKAKGERSVKRVIDYEKSLGNIPEKVERGGRFAKAKDLFAGVCVECWKKDPVCLSATCDPDTNRFSGFDVVSLGKEGGQSVVKLIQVKTNVPAPQKKYKLFARKYASPTIRVYVYTWYDRKGLRIQHYTQRGTIKETDLRKQ